MKHLVLGSLLLFFTACVGNRHNCSAYAHKIEKQLKKSNLQQLTNVLSREIDFTNDFNIYIFGHYEEIRSKEELAYLLSQVLSDLDCKNMTVKVGNRHTINVFNYSDQTCVVHYLPNKKGFTIQQIDFIHQDKNIELPPFTAENQL